MLAKAPGDRESAGLPHSAAMTRKLGGAPMAGPQKVTAKGPMEGTLKARELQYGMISNHAELKLVISGEAPSHGPCPRANLKASFGVMPFEVRGR